MGSSLSVRAETSSGLSACQIVVKGLGVTLADPLVPNCLVSHARTHRSRSGSVCGKRMALEKHGTCEPFI
jgi:hypothetical protein